jgi:hypothetical protein
VRPGASLGTGPTSVTVWGRRFASRTACGVRVLALSVPAGDDRAERRARTTSARAHGQPTAPLGSPEAPSQRPVPNDPIAPADRDTGRSEAAVGQQSRFGRGEQSRKLQYGAWRSASGTVVLVAEVDDAEAIAVGVRRHDEVRVVGIAVPVDSFAPMAMSRATSAICSAALDT